MEKTVMAISLLQSNMMLCGTKEGHMYVLDTYRSRRDVEHDQLGVTDHESTLELPSDLGSSTWRHTMDEMEELILARYPKLFRHGISCIEYHPRLPSLIAIGLRDGSVHLLFLEGENLELKKTKFLFKLNNRVQQLEWLLVDASKEEDKTKIGSTSYVERIWKAISRSPYHSVLFARSGGHVRSALIERDVKLMDSFNFGRNETSNNEERCCRQYRTGDGRVNHHAGFTNLEKKMAIPTDSEVDSRDKICMILIMKWPLLEYFKRDLEYPTMTNFCRVLESLCIIRQNNGNIYMDIHVPEVQGSKVVFTRFATDMKLQVKGIPTSASITPKQYNQTNRHLVANNEHMYTINGELCLNAAGQFIAIGTNEGYVYTTSLLHIYNSAYTAYSIAHSDHGTHTADAYVMDAAVGNDVYETIAIQPLLMDNNIKHGTDLISQSSDETEDNDPFSCGSESITSDSSSMDWSAERDIPNAEIAMASKFIGSAVSSLMWSLIWKDFTAPPSFINPSNCCCTRDVIFLLAAVNSDQVHLMRLSKEEGALNLYNVSSINTPCNSIQWIEGTIPDDMTLWMSIPEGIRGITCHYQDAA